MTYDCIPGRGPQRRGRCLCGAETRRRERFSGRIALLSVSNEQGEIGGLQRVENVPDCPMKREGVLQRALTIAADTGGAFDPTLYPLAVLWGFSTGAYHVPTEQELDSVLGSVGYLTDLADAAGRKLAGRFAGGRRDWSWRHCQGIYSSRGAGACWNGRESPLQSCLCGRQRGSAGTKAGRQLVDCGGGKNPDQSQGYLASIQLGTAATPRLPPALISGILKKTGNAIIIF